MTPTRREFIRNVGIAIGSLAMARCAALDGGGGTLSTKSGPPRDRARNCWLSLSYLAEVTQDWDHYERADEARDTLVADHRAALDDLVANGELAAGVADHVQEAFSAAAFHVWRSNAPITCYEPMLIDYTPTSAAQLVRQADLLAEMAESGALDPDVVAQAEAAIERDVAFLSLSSSQVQALYQELIAAAGDTVAYPSFDQLELDISPEAAVAADFLVHLLTEE
jgi:hypothetical protein